MCVVVVVSRACNHIERVISHCIDSASELRRVFSGVKYEYDTSNDEELKAAAKASPTQEEPNVVPCYSWVLHGVDPVRLPPIPFESLPGLLHTGLAQEALEEETKLVKIAALDNNIIGLTNKGHVLRYGELHGENEYQQGRWEYVRGIHIMS